VVSLRIRFVMRNHNLIRLCRLPQSPETPDFSRFKPTERVRLTTSYTSRKVVNGQPRINGLKKEIREHGSATEQKKTTQDLNTCYNGFRAVIYTD
jgi:hypothetical protein